MDGKNILIFKHNFVKFKYILNLVIILLSFFNIIFSLLVLISLFKILEQ